MLASNHLKLFWPQIAKGIFGITLRDQSVGLCFATKKAAAAARTQSTDAKHNATYAIRIGASMIVAGIVAESLRAVQVSLLLARALDGPFRFAPFSEPFLPDVARAPVTGLLVDRRLRGLIARLLAAIRE